MDASELLKAGKLNEAIDAQTAAVKAHPADSNRRLFLFEMLLFTGDLVRAGKQGVLVKFDDPEVNAAMDGYRLLVEHEKMRRRVLNEGEKPKSFGPLTEECTQRIQALAYIRDGRSKDAADILAKYPPPALTGTLDGKPFETLCDCDDVIGPILEVCTPQGYFWVPYSQVTSFKSVGPKNRRDHYWLPGQLELANGQNGPVFLPALYVDTYLHADDAVKLGGRTDWTGGDGAPVRGQGRKDLLVGEDVVSLLDIRELIVNPTNG